MTPSPAPPAWRDGKFAHGASRESIILWHGCLAKHARDIKNNGIDLKVSAKDTDFGQGFYCTTLDRQAKFWARMKYAAQTTSAQLRPENWPVVIKYRVDRKELAKLHSLHMFVRHDYDFEDYWSFVWRFRSRKPNASHHCTGQTKHLRANWYDVVTGPVTIGW